MTINQISRFVNNLNTKDNSRQQRDSPKQCAPGIILYVLGGYFKVHCLEFGC